MLGLPFYIKLNYCKYHTEKDIIPSFFVYLRLKSYNSCTIKMAKNPLYSLSIDEIESNAKDFVDNLGDKYSFTFEEKKVNEKRITISEGGNSGILICYIIKGQVSFQVQGKQKMSSLCEECKEHIIKTTKLELANRKSYTLRNIQEDDFVACMEALNELGYTTTEKEISDDRIKHSYKIRGKYNDELTIHYYTNGTLLSQGKITPLFLDFIVQCTYLLSTNDTVEELRSLLSIENSETIILDKDLRFHIPDNYDKIEGKLETFLNTSLLLINNVIALPDYSSFCYSALRALEGIIKKRIIEESGSFNDFGDYFEKEKGKHVLKSSSRPFSNDLTSQSIENAYDYLYRNRHPLFHVDDSIETSRVLTYDESVEITRKCLNLVSDLCRNWN